MYDAQPHIPIFISIIIAGGIIIGTWISSGIVPVLIYYGFNFIMPNLFLPSVLILCCIMSLITGAHEQQQVKSPLLIIPPLAVLVMALYSSFSLNTEYTEIDTLLSRDGMESMYSIVALAFGGIINRFRMLHSLVTGMTKMVTKRGNLY